MVSSAERADARREFVDSTPWRGQAIVPLSADASFRSYYRVAGQRPAVLMDAPPGKEDVRPFMAVTDHLRRHGLSAPEIYAADISRGFLLLEDMGDERVSWRLQSDSSAEEELYAAAIDILVELHQAEPPARLPVTGADDFAVPAYDADLLTTELMLLPDWYIGQGLGAPVDSAGAELFLSHWQPLLNEVAELRDALVLRDYHVDNLMCLDDRPGLQRLGLLDYQDAVIGHPAYDLVSLLEDARRDVPKALANTMLTRYMERAGVSDRTAFQRAYDILGAQRNAKIIGIFTRLSRRDDKHDYLKLIPHVWGLLEDDLDRLGVPGLTAWLDAHAPREARRRVLPPPA